MKTLANRQVRLWAAVLIALLFVIPAFIIGWIAGVHGGFDTGSKVTVLEIRNALREGIRDKFDFFIRDMNNIRFHPVGDEEVNICFTGNEMKYMKRVRALELKPDRD